MKVLDIEQTYKAENPLLWIHPRSDHQNTYSHIQPGRHRQQSKTITN